MYGVDALHGVVELRVPIYKSSHLMQPGGWLNTRNSGEMCILRSLVRVSLYRKKPSLRQPVEPID